MALAPLALAGLARSWEVLGAGVKAWRVRGVLRVGRCSVLIPSLTTQLEKPSASQRESAGAREAV